MALQTKTIKQNIKSVGNIKKMTKTMQMVSVTKMRRTVDISKRGQLYTHHTQLLASRLGKRSGFSHPIFKEGTGSKNLFVVISSDKGLCGGYNSHIDLRLKKAIKESDRTIDVIAIGKQSAKIAKRHLCEVIESYEKLNDFGDYNAAHKVAEDIQKLFLDGKYARVSVLSTDFISTFEMPASIHDVLPLSKELLAQPEDEIETTPYTFEQEYDEIIAYLIPELLAEIMFGFFKDAKAAEHTSRMIAMQQATDSAESVQKELIHDYNRARQAAVTQEITEITNAANAV